MTDWTSTSVLTHEAPEEIAVYVFVKTGLNGDPFSWTYRPIRSGRLTAREGLSMCRMRDSRRMGKTTRRLRQGSRNRRRRKPLALKE